MIKILTLSLILYLIFCKPNKDIDVNQHSTNCPDKIIKSIISENRNNLISYINKNISITIGDFDNELSKEISIDSIKNKTKSKKGYFNVNELFFSSHETLKMLEYNTFQDVFSKNSKYEIYKDVEGQYSFLVKYKGSRYIIFFEDDDKCTITSIGMDNFD